MELLTLVNAHHPVNWRRAVPHQVLCYYALYSLHQHLEHTQSSTQSLFSEEVTVLGICSLEGSAMLGDHGDKVQWCVLLVHVLHHYLCTLVLYRKQGKRYKAGQN